MIGLVRIDAERPAMRFNVAEASKIQQLSDAIDPLESSWQDWDSRSRGSPCPFITDEHGDRPGVFQKIEWLCPRAASFDGIYYGLFRVSISSCRAYASELP